MKNTYEIWIFNFNSTILVNFSIFINLIFLYIFKLIIKLIMPLSWFDLGSTLKLWTSPFYGSMNGSGFKTMFILCQREIKKHWVVLRARPCMLHFRAVDHFILEGKRPWVSKYHNDCVRGKICFKEIVSNTRLDLNHSSFTHLVCEFLIIYRFLLIYIQYLFIALVYHIYLCYCLYLDLCVVPFALSQK